MKTSIKAITLLAGASLVLAACGGETQADDSNTDASADTSADETTDETADSEGDDQQASGDASGTITVYTSELQENIDELVAAFNEEHPDITVEVFRAGTGDLTARLEAEMTSTGEPAADVFMAADIPTYEGFKDQDMLLQYSSVHEADLLPEVLDADGYYTGTRITPTVIAYNTGQIDTPPQSWQELTEAEYAGNIVMPNPDVSGAAAFNSAVWLDSDALGLEWLEALAANEPVIADSNGPVSQAVASGTQGIGVVVDYMIYSLADAGSPVAVVYPEEGVPYVTQPVGIFNTTDNPEAAKTFVDFVLSPAGQEVAVGQFQLPVRGDVGTPEGAPDLADIELMTPADMDAINESKTDAVNTFNELFW